MEEDTVISLVSTVSHLESMLYDQLRDVVAKRKPGWEYLQHGLISIDPVRSRDDPVVVKNIPYFKAKKALEAEVLKLDPPPRPENWGLNEMLEGKVRPYIQNMDNGVIPPPIVMQAPKNQDHKERMW
ncbi:hypothetical protein ACSBR1_009478 [Camellia fascicularis]